MKCVNCNAKLNKNDIFCPECGKNLIKEKTSLLNEIKKHKNKIFLFTGVLLIIIIGINLLSYFMSPRFLADKYIKAIADKDYNEIYEMTNLKDSDLVNIKMLKEKISNIEIDEYKYDGMEYSENNIYVRYIYSKNNKINTIYVELAKSINKNLLFFDNYKVLSSKVAQNVTLEIPKDSTVLLDDIDISSYLTETNEIYDIYIIDEMILGEYNIKITLPNNTTINKEVELETDSIYTIGDFEVADNLKNTLTEDITKKLNILYPNAINNNNYNSIGLDNLSDEYKTIKSYIQTSNTKLTAITFTDISAESITYEKNLKVTFSVGCNYSVNYTYNDEIKTYSGMGYTNIDVEFSYNDGNYKIESINGLPTNFKIR